MGFLADIKTYTRFAAGLPGFLRNPISLEDARAIIKHRLEHREERFLKLVEKAVFGYQNSQPLSPTAETCPV